MNLKQSLAIATASTFLLASPVMAKPGSGQSGEHSKGHGAETSEAARSKDLHGPEHALGVLETTPASDAAKASLRRVIDKLLLRDSEAEK